CGFTPAPSQVVRPPRDAQSPMSFECKTTHVIRLNPREPRGPTAVIGEVVYVRARDGAVNERFHVDPDRSRTIGRMGGKGYCRTRERFALEPKLATLTAPAPFTEDVGPEKMKP